MSAALEKPKVAVNTASVAELAARLAHLDPSTPVVMQLGGIGFALTRIVHHEAFIALEGDLGHAFDLPPSTSAAGK